PSCFMAAMNCARASLAIPTAGLRTIWSKRSRMTTPCSSTAFCASTAVSQASSPSFRTATAAGEKSYSLMIWSRRSWASADKAFGHSPLAGAFVAALVHRDGVGLAIDASPRPVAPDDGVSGAHRQAARGEPAAAALGAGSEAPLGLPAVPLQGFSALVAPAEPGVDQSPAGEATCLRHRNPSVLRSLSVSGTRPSLSVAPCISDLVTNCNLCRKKPCDQGFYPSEVQPSGSSRDHSIICSRCFRHRPALDVAGSPHSGLWLPHERALRQHRRMALLLNMVTEPRPGQAGGSPSEHDTDGHPPRRGQTEAPVQPCRLQLPHLGRQRLVLRPRVVEPDERARRESPPEVVELLHPQ